EYWDSGREIITAEAAAAAQGALAGGADEIVLFDDHFSIEQPNLIPALLPEGCRIARRESFGASSGGVDAMLHVGSHARSGEPGFMSHTYVPNLRLRVDGELIAETHVRAWTDAVPLLGIVGSVFLE